jgi:hypothetical protein
MMESGAVGHYSREMGYHAFRGPRPVAWEGGSSQVVHGVGLMKVKGAVVCAVGVIKCWMLLLVVMGGRGICQVVG